MDPQKNLDPLQKLIDLSLGDHQNTFIRFRGILHTDTQTDRRTDRYEKHNLVGGGN